MSQSEVAGSFGNAAKVLVNVHVKPQMNLTRQDLLSDVLDFAKAG